MKRSVGATAIWLTSTKLISLILVMITEMILSRFRSLEEFGTYSQLLMVITMSTTTFMLGLPNSINYFLAKTDSEKEQNDFISNYYTLSTIISIIAGGFLYLISPYIISYFNNTMIKSFVFILAILPWIKITNGSIDNLLVVYNKLKILSIYRITQSAVMLFAVIYSVFSDMSFYKYMIFYIILEVIFALTIYLIVNKVTPDFKPFFSKKLTKSLLMFSIPLGLASIISTLNIEISKFIVGKIFNTETLAVYTNAAREMPVTFISASLTAVLMPLLVNKLNNNKIKEAIELWKETTTLSYLVICSFATFLFVFAPHIMTILYGNKYISGVNIFRVYNVLLLVRVTYFGMILNALGKTKVIFISSILTLFINTLFIYIFYLFFGIMGPAIATVISLILMAIFQLKYTSTIINVTFREIFPWNNLFKITLINILIGLVIGVVANNLHNLFNINILTVLILSGIIWILIGVFIFKKQIKISWSNLKS